MICFAFWEISAVSKLYETFGGFEFKYLKRGDTWFIGLLLKFKGSRSLDITGGTPLIFMKDDYYSIL